MCSLGYKKFIVIIALKWIKAVKIVPKISANYGRKIEIMGNIDFI